MSHSRVEGFRKRYRASMSRYYHPLAHLIFVFAVGAIFVAYQLAHSSVSSALVLNLALALLLFNIAEYCVHRQLGHVRRRYAGLFYLRHSLHHHRFFDADHMSIDSIRDWRVTLFPAWLVVVVVALSWAFSAVLALVTAIDQYALSAGFVASYLLYEFMHLCFHLPESHPLARVPGVAYMRRWHQIHHQPQLMHDYHFNLTAPICDCLLGTRAQKDQQIS